MTARAPYNTRLNGIRNLPHTFNATFAGHCDGCGCKTLKGDPITRTSKGEFFCAECDAK